MLVSLGGISWSFILLFGSTIDRVGSSSIAVVPGLLFSPFRFRFLLQSACPPLLGPGHILPGAKQHKKPRSVWLTIEHCPLKVLVVQQ